MRTFGRLCAVGWILLIACQEQLGAQGSTAPSASLFLQSAARSLTHVLEQCGTSRAVADFLCSQRQNLSYLLIDAQSGTVLPGDWPGSETPIPMGSLVKPFTALAYGEKHEFKYPVHVCRGTASACWLPRGHGEMRLDTAIANSCNAYFSALTRNMRASDVRPVALMFGLEQPDAHSSDASLAGMGAHWPISPLAMARAYVELSHRFQQPGVGQILAGMEQSSRVGTGAAVGRALTKTTALVKTGTAPCTHPKRAPGDGFAIVMVPADHPEILLMVRMHGMPGSRAARVAGELLRQIQ